ncbi:MAG: HAD family phosphatase [Prevotellaceae bacterium]|nr:HAD family phosphatase [Prevotellaceae bacterium]MDY3856916.1 HAD family phosphatase [Bacteroidaceae bacterium]
MKQIKTIAFDMGGVIFTMDWAQAVARFEEIGVSDAEHLLDPYTQRGIFGDMEAGRISDEDFRRKLSAYIGKELTWQQCQYGWKGYVAEVPKRNLDALQQLRKQGYRLVLLSNTNPYMMSWVFSPEFDGQGHSLRDYMDDFYLSYVCKIMKPDPAIFQLVVDREGLDPSEILFLDDSAANIRAAQGVGLHTLQPQNGGDWTQEIYQHLN